MRRLRPGRPTPFLLALALLASGPASAQEEAAPEVQAFLREWAARMRDVRTLRVEFVQTKQLRMLRRPLVSEGVTLLKGPRLLMTVRGRDGERETALLVTPGEARLYHPRLKRLEVYPIREGEPPPSAMPLFGGDVEALPRDYRIALSRDDAGLDVLELEPRAAGSELSRFVMRFRDYTVVAVEQVNRKGDRVRMEITAFVKNPVVEEEDLRLDLPADVTEVRVDLGGAPPAEGSKSP